MNRNALMQTAFVCLLSLSFTACQKEITEKQLSSDEISAANGPDQNGSCKLTVNSLDFDDGVYAQLDEFTYKNGLLDEWFVSYGGNFRLQYSQNGKMKSATYLFEDAEVYHIDFVYEQNRVVKEIWTDPATGEGADLVTNYYNQRGLITSSTSEALDYIVLYDWDQKGNCTRWRYFASGALLQQGEYTYANDVRNPFETIKGLGYLFGYANGALFSGQNSYISERVTVYDENGTPSILWDLDPRQTTFDLRPGRLPATGTYVDQLTAAPYIQQFAYDACGKDSNKRSGRSNPGKNLPGVQGKLKRPMGY